MTVRVIVCGSRTWTDRARIADRLHDLVLAYPRGTQIVIVHGDNARGADRIAHQEAEKGGLLVEPHHYRRWIEAGVPPKLAPKRRNEHMASLGAELCLAFWRDGSTGTEHMVGAARACGIPVEIVRP